MRRLFRIGLIVFFALLLAIFLFMMIMRDSFTFRSYYAYRTENILDPLAANTPSRTVEPPSLGIGPSEGKAQAPITVVEFTDYDCPLCALSYSSIYLPLKKDYIDTGKIRYEVRNFPLTNVHRFAEIVAEASLCAARQDAFWEMHGLLFSTQSERAMSSDIFATLVSYADRLKFDRAAFSQCLTDRTMGSKVHRDVLDGGLAGVTGTPSFWLLGKHEVRHIDGAYPYAAFTKALDEMLKNM